MDEKLKNKLLNLYEKYMQAHFSLTEEDNKQISIFEMNDSLEVHPQLFNIHEIPKFQETQSTIKITSENFEQLCGRVMAQFEDDLPHYGSGILLDPYHVLTSAVCLFNLKKAPNSITFFTYSHEHKMALNPLKVKSFGIPNRFLKDFSKDIAGINYALLTLETGIDSMGNFSLPFLSEEELSTQDLDYQLWGFEGLSKEIKKLPFTIVESNNNFITYKSNNAEISGSPLIAQKKEGSIYLLGLYARKAFSHEASSFIEGGVATNTPAALYKKALKITPAVQAMLQPMKHVEILTLYKLATKENNINAQYQLGILYQQGKEIEKNEEEAFK